MRVVTLERVVDRDDNISCKQTARIETLKHMETSLQGWR